jgi:hypothetical protein
MPPADAPRVFTVARQSWEQRFDKVPGTERDWLTLCKSSQSDWQGYTSGLSAEFSDKGKLKDRV